MTSSLSSDTVMDFCFWVGVMTLDRVTLRRGKVSVSASVSASDSLRCALVFPLLLVFLLLLEGVLLSSSSGVDPSDESCPPRIPAPKSFPLVLGFGFDAI